MKKRIKFRVKGSVFMKTFKKIMAIGCAAIMTVATMNITVRAANNTDAYLKELSEKLGGVEIVATSDLDPSDSDYWVAFYDNNHKTPIVDSSNPDPDENYLEYENKIENPQLYTTSNTKYNVYSSNGNTLKYRNIRSVFRAIGLASSTGDYVKETDTGTVVFTKDNSTSTFYKFQFTKYYGQTTDASNAQSWVKNYRYAHVVDGTGRIKYNSYYSLKGTPDSYTLEPESGGYYYKFSYSYNGHKSSYNKVVFSNSDLKFPEEYIYNAYIYSAVVSSSQTLEVGIMSSKGLGGDWYVYSSDQDGLINCYINKRAASRKKVIDSENNGTYVYKTNGTVEIKVSVRDGGATGIVTSSLLNESNGTITLDGDSFTANGRVTFLQACSLVQAIENGVTSDIRNGGYLKNISFNNCKLYNNTDFSGTGYDFYSDSPYTYYAFLYNDDCINYTKNSNTKESITIDYSAGYQE